MTRQSRSVCGKCPLRSNLAVKSDSGKDGFVVLDDVSEDPASPYACANFAQAEQHMVDNCPLEMEHLLATQKPQRKTL